MNIVTDTRPASRYYEIDGIPTVNLGTTDLNTGDRARTLMLEFFFGWAILAGLGPWPGARLTIADRCTCCEKKRLMYRYGFDNDEWAHADDHEYAEHKHLHVSSSSRDCDGSYDRGATVRLNSGIAPWALRPSRAMIGAENEEPTWHDLVTYMFEQTGSIWSGPCTKEIDTDAGYMRWHTVTEEGYEAGEVRICTDTYCAYDDEDDRYRR